ncbi:hypothetical protein [Lacticaseibacillus absianus]|uniref:hypothetical protein n=1 Tax=Lacticaseibacillus absianus TaxID=2729623 RepID=UPI0015C90E1B|nr:hypothetical protein [Lacticaseibacillus absianus]
MRRAGVKALVLTAALILIAVLTYNYRHVRMQYREFAVTKKHVNSAQPQLKLDAETRVDRIRQHKVNGRYVATLQVVAQRAKPFNITAWFLDQGVEDQAAQLQLSVNGKGDTRLQRGVNQVTLTATYRQDAQKQTHLAVLLHPAHGKYVRVDFLG